jgi:anti-sigma factor RsiW
MSLGETHLAQEAVAALVDGELLAGPAARAARHLTGCLTCRLAVEAQREAKAALTASADVAIPGDLLSRLCSIPFTADVPGARSDGLAAGAGAGQLTLSGPAGSWSVDLQPSAQDARPEHHARWLRRGVAGTLLGLGAGVTALALNLPADGDASPHGPAAGSAVSFRHTDIAPPVVRTVDVGTRTSLLRPGGTP